ncbi:hypothetical protein ACWIUA_12055 [Ursidibacter sp. B-7004-1]
MNKLKEAIQEIGADIKMIFTKMKSIDTHLTNIDGLLEQVVLKSDLENINIKIIELSERIARLEQGKSQESPEQVEPPKTEPPKQSEMPSVAQNIPNTELYRSRTRGDDDTSVVIKNLTAWFNALPKDDGTVDIKNGYYGNISYSKAGKIFVYFDGFRKFVNLTQAGLLHEFSGSSSSLNDGEREYNVGDAVNYDRTTYENVHITVVRQADDGQLYAVHNSLSSTSRGDVFDSL